VPHHPPELITPYGGKLVDLLVAPEAHAELKARATRLPSIQLSERSVCDLELLATGAFSPLDRFLGKADYDRVLAEMRLASGVMFPVPITLPVARQAPVQLDSWIALRDSRNDLLGVMRVEEIYEWDKRAMARQVLGTEDLAHPLVTEMDRWGQLNVSGRLEILALPARHDFRELRLTPAATRARLLAAGGGRVVAFQTRNPMHRAHEELTRRAAQSIGAKLLIHPSVGMTKPGDVDHYTRVRTYKSLVDHDYYEQGTAFLALLPLAMRLAGPREAVWHAIIRRNHGASDFIVGRDHASPGVDSTGKPFYGPYDAQELADRLQPDHGVGVLKFSEMVYLPDEARYEETSRLAPGAKTVSISGTQVREQYLNAGKLLPEWFTRPEVARILAETYPPRHRQGACVWFTGLSGAGKSATAEVLITLLLEHGRQVTVLDGDVVRTHLSAGLGFSKEDRDTNVRRIGFVASEVVRHGGIAICAAVSPYRAARESVRQMVGGDRFLEVFVDTPLSVCEQRDSKGVYAKARRGEIKGFTGIDDPYESPEHAEITLETVRATPAANAEIVLKRLQHLGFIR
jgi:sulfate adenylyltransferase